MKEVGMTAIQEDTRTVTRDLVRQANFDIQTAELLDALDRRNVQSAGDLQRYDEQSLDLERLRDVDGAHDNNGICLINDHLSALRAALAYTEPSEPSLPSVVDITGIDAIRRALVVEMENEGVVTWGVDGHRERFLSTEPSE